VLVTGGLCCGAVPESNTAEIYDPGTAKFSFTGSMLDKRWEHEAVLLNDGMVLVAGGYTVGGNQLSSAELFDPAGAGGAGSFTGTANMSIARIRFTMTLLADGRVLLAGGDNNNPSPVGTAEIFDPAGNGGAGSFGAPLTMVKWRELHTATLLADGRVLLAGGETLNFADQNTAEIFDPSAHGGAGGFVATGNMVNRRFDHAAVRLLDGRVLVAGHFNPAEIFNPKGNGGVGSFSSAGDLNVARDGLAGNLLFDGSVLLAGGTTHIVGSPGGPSAVAELFDPSKAGTVNAFTLTGNMNVARNRFRAVTLSNGLVLASGGTSDESSALSSAELYHPSGLPVATATATSTPTPVPTPTPTAAIIATHTAAPTATATVAAGTPVVLSVPKTIQVGASFTISGTGFTAGSVVNFFVATATGSVNKGPLTPSARTLPTALTIDVPDTIPLGQGFVSMLVINTDKGFKVSNLASALLQGSPAKGIPTIKTINGIGLAATSGDPDFATNNVETAVAQGSRVKLGGTAFDTVNGVAIDVFCACPGGKVGPFFLNPGNPGLTSTLLSFILPAKGTPNSPPTGPGSFVVTNAGAAKAYLKKSNAVSAGIGARISVSSVSQLGSTITVIGTGFSNLTVINFFNLQGTSAVNLGGLKPGGAPKIALTIVNETKFTFTVPAAAFKSPAYVQALNPPFVPFSSSGTDPGGAFKLK
jgi:hypothetical protein